MTKNCSIRQFPINWVKLQIAALVSITQSIAPAAERRHDLQNKALSGDSLPQFNLLLVITKLLHKMQVLLLKKIPCLLAERWSQFSVWAQHHHHQWSLRQKQIKCRFWVHASIVWGNHFHASFLFLQQSEITPAGLHQLGMAWCNRVEVAAGSTYWDSITTLWFSHLNLRQCYVNQKS